MPKSKIILSIGFLVALLPVLGFPHSWESFFQVVFGLSIVALSVLISVDRRLSLKARVHKRQIRKRALVDSEMARQNPEVYGRREVDKHPEARTAVGRRAADLVAPTRIGRRASDAHPITSPTNPSDPEQTFGI